MKPPRHWRVWILAIAMSFFAGSLLGVALGVRAWAFLAGCGAGAALAGIGFERLRSRPWRKHGSGQEAAPRYNLESDQSTDNQRWLM